ncbi:MAG: hypothetical protein K6G58_09880, partial [Lachnospiraceae bacterium]|nr:hypothetical protein [Lachnospiraceae bacterium]
ESMDALLDYLDGNTEYDTRFVEGYVSYNESCGCDLTRDIRSDYNRLVDSTRRETETTYKQTYIRQMLNESRSMEEYMEALGKCREMLEAKEMAVCLNGSFFEGEDGSEHIGYDDEICAYSDEGKETFDRSEHILPGKWREKYKVFLFASLRSSCDTYGYMVMPYDGDFFTRFRHRIFQESMSLALEKLHQKIIISRLKEQKG